MGRSEYETGSGSRCEMGACSQVATQRCAGCGRALCHDHTVTDYTHLPGGQRPYCVDCDAQRRQLYQRARQKGLSAVAWSAGGAITGAIAGYVVGALATSDSFAHTVTTDVGFILGLIAALFIASTRLTARHP